MKNQVMLLGKLASAVEALSDEVRAAGLVPVVAATSQEAFAALAGDAMCAIVYEAGASPVETVCTAVRGNPRFDSVALVAFVEQTDREVLGPVFRTGADDYLLVGESGLEEKLRELVAQAATGKPTFIKGRAILADVDRQWRVQGARILRQANYDVHFAVDAEEVAAVLERDPTIQLVVADVNLPKGGSLTILESLRRRGIALPVWIGCGTTEDRAAVEERITAAGSASFHDRAMPPENLMFLINATTMTPARSQRASERLLHSAPVSFHLDGRPGVVWGSTYNISRQGLYIRTLTPAPYGAEIDLRLHAPGDGPLVEMRARVVWRKEFGAQGGVPGPTGMGVVIVATAGSGVAEYEAGYDRLLARPPQSEMAA